MDADKKSSMWWPSKERRRFVLAGLLSVFFAVVTHKLGAEGFAVGLLAGLASMHLWFSALAQDDVDEMEHIADSAITGWRKSIEHQQEMAARINDVTAAWRN